MCSSSNTGQTTTTTTGSAADEHCPTNVPLLSNDSSSFPSKGKSSLNGKRIRDAGGYRQRAACICTRVGADGQMQVLLVSAKRRQHWILPGGGVEANETKEQAVLRELEEEAGVAGTIVASIGDYRDDKRYSHTCLYMVRVSKLHDEWLDNKTGRERQWVCVKEALHLIKPDQLEMLKQNIQRITDMGGGGLVGETSSIVEQPQSN